MLCFISVLKSIRKKYKRLTNLQRDFHREAYYFKFKQRNQYY